MKEPTTYEITVQGHLDRDWARWLGEAFVLRQHPISLRTTSDAAGPTTILTCTLEDQAALRGLLSRIWDLNLTVLSVNSMPTHDAGEGAIRRHA